MNKYIKSDLYRYTGNTSWTAFWKLYFSEKKFRWQVGMRTCQQLYRGGAKQMAKILWRLVATWRFDIPYKTNIGYGLYLGHNGPIVINKNTIIGNNCNISQGLTIGTNHELAAVIGDNVYIGPNVCIVENVHIGDNVTIGAGSVVTKDIPANATAAGNYAKVLNYNEPGRYIGNCWKYE